MATSVHTANILRCLDGYLDYTVYVEVVYSTNMVEAAHGSKSIDIAFMFITQSLFALVVCFKVLSHACALPSML